MGVIRMCGNRPSHYGNTYKNISVYLSFKAHCVLQFGSQIIMINNNILFYISLS